jgi:molybdopterin converting factor small subunit
MEVRVTFAGLNELARAVGQKEVSAQLSGDTLGDLLRHLEQAYGAPLRKSLLTPAGTVHETVQVLRNGATWIARDDLQAPLKEGDSVTFLLMMAGG